MAARFIANREGTIVCRALHSEGATSPMRSLSKAILVAAGLFVIGAASSQANPKTFLAGTFTLAHPTRWKNTVLPAGNYSFKMARTETDANVLSVRGTVTTLDVLVFAQSACATCEDADLKIAVKGENRVVTALDLPGYHVEFNSRRTPAEKELQLGKKAVPSEQVAVHVDSN
jgi:hypothetical protein